MAILSFNKVSNIIRGASFKSLSLNKSEMDINPKINVIKKCIPPLDGMNHKGQSGRIGIVGGSLEYTGAPYFAGISALKVGADLVHIFCASTAAYVIKSYSPELIVHPLLDHSNALHEITPWFDRLHALVIGPGLGRDNQIFELIEKLIKAVQVKNIPLVIDADGLFLITEKPDIIKNSQSPIILTPNKIEFERLYSKLNGTEGIKALGKNIVILKKGTTDELISTIPDIEWKSDFSGSGRRCGGQGDLLSGSIATFLHWTISNSSNIENSSQDKALLSMSLSCYAASKLIRLCNRKAFESKGRSMLATDMIEYIHESFEEIFGQ